MSVDQKYIVGGAAVVISLGVVRWLASRGKKKTPPPAYAEAGEEAQGSSRVVVIGGNGFIGKLVVAALVEDAFNERRRVVSFDMRLPPKDKRLAGVRYIQGSILEPEHLLKAMQGATSVIHLASLKKFLGVDDNAIRNVNVQGTKNVVAACLERNVKNLVYTSSIVVALKANNLSHNMNLPHNAPRSGSYVDIYAETKAAAEEVVMEAGKGGKLRTCSLRPTAVFGVGDGVLADKLLVGENNNDHVGSGLAEFDWIDGASVARCHALALRSLESRTCTAAGQIYNCGSGEVIQYRKFNGFGTGWWGHGQPKEINFGFAQFLATINETVCSWTGLVLLPASLMHTSLVMTQVSWSVDIETTKRDLGFTTVHPTIGKSIAALVSQHQAAKGVKQA